MMMMMMTARKSLAIHLGLRVSGYTLWGYRVICVLGFPSVGLWG